MPKGVVKPIKCVCVLCEYQKGEFQSEGNKKLVYKENGHTIRERIFGEL